MVIYMWQSFHVDLRMPSVANPKLVETFLEISNAELVAF